MNDTPSRSRGASSASSQLAICVSTSRPSSATTGSGGGGCLTVLSPQTGSILSSWRGSTDSSGRNLIGMSTLSLLAMPHDNSNLWMMGYGGSSTSSTAKSNKDTYAMLFSSGSDSLSSPPHLQWKCRLPESPMTAGLLVSPPGSRRPYIVGGGVSGNLYVWDALNQGALVKVVPKAHIRAVTTLCWISQNDDSFIMTGGADGMCHVYSLMDLVGSNHSSNKQPQEDTLLAPVRTWSVHQLPVTALVSYSQHVMISASEDGQIVLMEVFSGKTIHIFQMSSGIRSLTCHGNRIYAGAVDGTIFRLDLDIHAAVAQQQRQHSTRVKRRRIQGGDIEDDIARRSNRIRSWEDEDMDDDLFGAEETIGTLRGHDRPVTSLACAVGQEQQGSSTELLLISGDESGTIRVWVLSTNSCVRILQPWSSSPSLSIGTGDGTKAKASSTLHPVTSIIILPKRNEGRMAGIMSSSSSAQPMLGMSDNGMSSKSTMNTIASLLTPLQRFQSVSTISSNENDNHDRMVPVPFLLTPHQGLDRNITSVMERVLHLRSKCVSTEARVPQERPDDITESQPNEVEAELVKNGQDTSKTNPEASATTESSTDGVNKQQKDQEEEIKRLLAELEEAQATIQRWETVNNKLVAQLKRTKR